MAADDMLFHDGLGGVVARHESTQAGRRARSRAEEIISAALEAVGEEILSSMAQDQLMSVLADALAEAAADEPDCKYDPRRGTITVRAGADLTGTVDAFEIVLRACPPR